MFEFHRLNEQGQAKAVRIQALFEDLVKQLGSVVGHGEMGVEWARGMDRLEEACFFIKKSMAVQARNQERAQDAPRGAWDS